MAQHDADRVADWNGQSGERWVTHQARLDARLAVFGQAAIEAAAPAAGERVLDVGCGAGASSLALAARVGAGARIRASRMALSHLSSAPENASGYALPTRQLTKSPPGPVAKVDNVLFISLSSLAANLSSVKKPERSRLERRAGETRRSGLGATEASARRERGGGSGRRR